MVKDIKKNATDPVVDKEKSKVVAKKESKSLVVKIQNEVTSQLASKEVMSALIGTTFKGLGEVQVKQAITEGMMRGFTFKDFLEKNVYAIPFNSGSQYSLITSIDYARKIGMRNGIVGKSAPTFTYTDEKKVESCTITVKKNIDGVIGEFTETVYFDEYYKAGYQGKQTLWDTKPRTMIAKVAEMHALRMACPEALSQAYVEEEFQKETKGDVVVDEISDEEKIMWTEKLESAQSIEQLGAFWSDLPPQAKVVLESKKNELKTKLTITNENSKI
jgi:hypothetical protein